MSWIRAAIVRTGLTLALALALALSTVACAAGPGSSEPPGSTEDGRPARSLGAIATLPPSASPMLGEVPAPILDAILSDAAERTDLDVEDFVVVMAQAVTWPDGSLGCPEPGMLYTQALVDGYQVVVEADGQQLDYRVGGGGSFQICEEGRPGDGA